MKCRWIWLSQMTWDGIFKVGGSMEKKSRILYLLKYLHENSDDSHPVSSIDIMNYLSEQGIKMHRTTINSDIGHLQEIGFDIITIRSSPNKYFIGARQLQLPDLKLLVDAVASSKFITLKKSTELIEKISLLVSKNQALELKREIYTEHVIKPHNEETYYTTDRIQEAIRSKKVLEFKYLKYTATKELIFKNHGFAYVVSPYTMICSDDHYYMIGYSNKHKKVVTFRVDCIVQAEVLAITAYPTPTEFNPTIYTNQIFEMFNGTSTTIELKCSNDLMHAVVDRFGEGVNTSLLGSNHFKVITEICISQSFYGWVFGFGGKISILGPTEIKEEYRNIAKKIIE